MILTDTTAQEREEERGVSGNLRRDLELCKLLAVLGNTAPVVVPTEQSNGKTENDHVHSDDDRLPIEKSLAMVMRIDANDNGRSVVSTSRALRAASVDGAGCVDIQSEAEDVHNTSEESDGRNDQVDNTANDDAQTLAMDGNWRQCSPAATELTRRRRAPW